MAKYFIGGYEVSLDTKIQHERQQERNRREEIKDQEGQEQMRLLEQIEKNTRSCR